MSDHDARYDYADEYLEVLYKLFEGSWEEDAVLRDRERRVFSDPSKIHEIRHQGKYFQVPGIHLCEPSPQRTPVLYQAGAHARNPARPVARLSTHRSFPPCPPPSNSFPPWPWPSLRR